MAWTLTLQESAGMPDHQAYSPSLRFESGSRRRYWDLSALGIQRTPDPPGPAWLTRENSAFITVLPESPSAPRILSFYHCFTRPKLDTLENSAFITVLPEPPSAPRILSFYHCFTRPWFQVPVPTPDSRLKTPDSRLQTPD